MQWWCNHQYVDIPWDSMLVKYRFIFFFPMENDGMSSSKVVSLLWSYDVLPDMLTVHYGKTQFFVEYASFPIEVPGPHQFLSRMTPQKEQRLFPGWQCGDAV